MELNLSKIIDDIILGHLMITVINDSNLISLKLWIAMNMKWLFVKQI